jgi:hypothetical protein
MRASRRRTSPCAECRRALALLAGSADGVTEALMLAHGLTVELMVALVRAGLSPGVKRSRWRGCGSPRRDG